MLKFPPEKPDKKKPEKKSKPGKKSSLGRLAKGVALFGIYAAVYPKIAEHVSYWISDAFFKRR